MSEQLRTGVHRYFQEFGHDIAEAIYQQLIKPGGMKRLLRKLGVPDPENSTEQYEALINHLRMQGSSQFQQLVGLKKLDYRIKDQNPAETDSPYAKAARERFEALKRQMERESREAVQKPAKPILIPVKAPTFDAAATPEPMAEPEVAQQKAAKGLAPAPAKPSVKSPYDRVDKDGFPIGPLVQAPAPDPSALDPKAPSWDSSKPFDPTGTWPEVERRSGRERRRHPDRRKAVDIVFENKRYGGDRRSKKERRKNWPKGGHVKD